jgi:hypothetical protein
MVFRLEINASKVAFKIEIQWFIYTIKERLLLLPESESQRKEIIIQCLEQWQTSLNEIVYEWFKTIPVYKYLFYMSC